MIKFEESSFERIAVIDTEGINVRVGGSNRNKVTTCWIKKGCLQVYDFSTGLTYVHNFMVKFPSWDIMEEKVKKQWIHTHAIHKLSWEDTPESYEDWADCSYGTCEEILLELGNALVGVDVIFAKGKYLEDRFLNNLGMCGDEISKVEMGGRKREYHIKDLNDYGVEKYDKYLYDKICRGVKKYPERKLNWYGELIVYNYENDLPIPHDPEKECDYFLKEAKKIFNL